MEGKKKYFALVIFLFLGLMVFTFANPAEEDTEFTDGGTNTSETTKKDDKTTTTEDTKDGQDTQTVLNNVTNTNTNTNNTTTVTDTSLADAIAAVEKAEGTYTQEDVDAAKELVNNVTDTTEKGELENRLQEVEAGIAVDALLKELEAQVEAAANKDDMNNATDYRDENEIATKIAALTNETVAEALQARLDEVSKLLDDNAAPVITGVEDGKAYAENTTITVEDAEGNAFTVTMEKDGEEVNIEDGYATTGEGVYTLTVVDEAFNEVTVTFTVDMTDPKFVGLTNGGHYKEVTINVEDLTDVTITVTNMDTNETTTVDNGTVLTEEATYKLVATDAAGNKTTYYVAIDTTKPTISGVTNNSYVNKSENAYIRDKFLTLVTVTATYADGTTSYEEFTRADFTVGERNENFELKYRATKEGTYTIYAEDKYGNNYSETFTIDRTAAKLVSANMYSNGNKYTEDKNTVYYTTNGNVVTAYIRVNEKLKDVPVFTFELGETVYVTTDVTESFHNADDEAAGIYRYQTTMSVDEFNPEVDGDIKITVSDIVDRAGNTTNDVTSVTNKNIVRIDRTAAARVYSTLRVNKTEYEQDGITYYYVKNGDKFEFAISFNELLAEVPTVTIGGREVEMVLNEKVLTNESKYLYEGTFTIAEDETELPEGTLEIKVTNIKDLAGNETTLADQTRTSNSRSVVYDRTAATRMSADFYVNGLTQVEKTFYTQYNKSLVVNITTNEQLAEIPTFTLHNNGNDYVIEGAIYRGLNDKGYHLYQATYEIKEDSGMTDGEITFTVSNIVDRAGNTTNDVTEATNGRKIVLDNVVDVDKLSIIGSYGQWKDKEYIQYAKTGTIVYVNARFYEELAETPVVTLNDKVTLTKATKKYDEKSNVWIYSYSYKLQEDDGLEDGTIQVKVTNIKDFAGNTVVLTNEDMTLESQSEVVIDRTLPTVRFTKAGSSLTKDEITPVIKDGVYYFNQDVRVTLSDAVNLRLHGVDTFYDDKNVNRTGWLTDVTTAGEHTVVAEDEVGNRLEFTLVIDKTAPTVEVKEYIGSNPYSGMSFKLSDNVAIDYFELNGTKYDRTDAKYSDANYQNIKSSLVNGENTLVLYDIVGNSTTYTFTLDRVAPTITVSDGTVGTGTYSKLNLKLYDKNGIASVVINDTKLAHTGTYVDINDGHAYTFLDGTNTVVVTDKAGNTTTQTFIVNRALEAVNGVINVSRNYELIDQPFYNVNENTEDVTINGNGYTVNQTVTAEEKFNFTENGTRTTMGNMFASQNGTKVTLNDLTFTGTTQSILLGQYRGPKYANYNTVFNNVNMIGLNVVSLSSDIAPAAVVYGTATLNNTNIYGTKLSSLETSPKWPVYDLAVVNYTHTYINGGKIGTIYTWAKAYLEINNAEIDTITTAIRKVANDFDDGELVIGEGTKVNTIKVTNAKAVITIKAGATVDTIDFNGLDQTNMTITIEDGATVNNQIA